MTHEEIKTYLSKMYEKYCTEMQSVTSVQLASFKTNFEITNSVTIDKNGTLTPLGRIEIDDVSSVRDVWYRKVPIHGFFRTKEQEFPFVTLENGFQFMSDSPLAVELKKGEKIRVYGRVNAYASYYDYLRIEIYPETTFSIRFTRIR